MLWKVKRRCRPTTLMLVLGFAISMTAVLIGISVIHDLLESLSSAGQEDPILQTIQNSGLSLTLRIYLFSMVNCMTAANFWVITRRRAGCCPFTLPPFSWEAPCCSCSLPWRSPRQSRLSAFWESIRRR